MQITYDETLFPSTTPRPRTLPGAALAARLRRALRSLAPEATHIAGAEWRYLGARLDQWDRTDRDRALACPRPTSMSDRT